MNRVLAGKMKEYISLNPLAINQVFNEFGISQKTPISVESVVNAYQYFKEPFAVRLFDALYPQIEKNMSVPVLSNVNGGPETITNDEEQVRKTNFWTGFSQVLNSLVAAVPAVTDSAMQLKYGYKPQPMPQNYPQALGKEPQGFNNNILIYVGIGFVALLALIVVFKKMK
jgi:hypothetical protein